MWMEIGWGLYFQMVGTHKHYIWSLKFFPPLVVETLKPSITFGSLPAHSPCSQLAPLAPSLLPLLLAYSPHSQLAPLAPSLLSSLPASSPCSQLTSGTMGCSGSKGSKLGARGASWKWGEQAGGFMRPQEGFKHPGMLWKQGEQAVGFLRPQKGFRDPGMLWKQGERAGSKGTKLGASWGPRKVPETQGCSGSKGSKLGLPEAPGRFQRPRDGLGAREANWEWGEWAGSTESKLRAFWGPRKVSRTQECSRSEGSKLETRGAGGASWEWGKRAGGSPHFLPPQRWWGP